MPNFFLFLHLLYLFLLRYTAEKLTRLSPVSSHGGELVCVVMRDADNNPLGVNRGRLSGVVSSSRRYPVHLYDLGVTITFPADDIMAMPEKYKARPIAIYHKFRVNLLPPGQTFAMTSSG